jgi:hypothetical protein
MLGNSKNGARRLEALTAHATLVVGLLAGCGGVSGNSPSGSTDGGTDGSGGGNEASNTGGDDAGNMPPDQSAPACPGGELSCPAGCVLDDAKNCGRCGHDCTSLPNVSGAVACDTVDGVCSFPPGSCKPGTADCNGNPDDGCETDVTTGAHCGSCTTSCAGGGLCSASVGMYTCVSSCSPTQQACGTSCVETMSDPNNCGQCGHACTTAIAHAQESCVGGVCVIGCSNGYALCNDACVDLTGDSGNCGGCGHLCPAGQTCASGVCSGSTLDASTEGGQPDGGGDGGGGDGGSGDGGSGDGGSGDGGDGGPVGCTVAAGTNGLISDFSNQAVTYALDGRTSHTWQLYNPAAGTDMLGVGSDVTGFFMRCTLNDVQAVCAAGMAARCYDARAYTGLQFRFKEGQAFAGKAVFALQTLATIPPSEGGTCTLGANCYDSFHVNLDVPATWTGIVRFPFSTFGQSGFGPAPPGYIPQSEIVSIAFAPQAGVGADIDVAAVSFY